MKICFGKIILVGCQAARKLLSFYVYKLQKVWKVCLHIFANKLIINKITNLQFLVILKMPLRAGRAVFRAGCRRRPSQMWASGLSDAGDDGFEIVGLGEVQRLAQPVAGHVDRAWLLYLYEYIRLDSEMFIVKYISKLVAYT